MSVGAGYDSPVSRSSPPAGRVRGLLVVALLLAAGCPAPRTGEAPPAESPAVPSYTIVFLGETGDERVAGFLRGAELAAQEMTREGLLGRPVRVVDGGRPSGVSLAGLVDDGDVLGALTAGGGAAIEAAGEALDASGFAVFELSDDLYETGVSRPSVFQAAIPHSWQAWRLARYFGPGDRGYRRIGLARDSSPAGQAAAGGLGETLAERNLAMVDATGSAEGAIGRLAQERPEAVVLEGSPAFLAETAALLAHESRRYLGGSRIRDGWRPQVAGFDSLLWASPPLPPGSVAAADYAAAGGGDGIPSVGRFRESYVAEFGRPPAGPEVWGYDAARALGQAARGAGGPERGRMIDALEHFDRVRFGHLPISLGPDDHLAAERDLLGLWARAAAGAEGAGWLPVMRTFTSDLERTNILDDDWVAYFEGAVPGGEAPFFHQARYGIVTDAKDDLQ